ncbi:MAG: glycoside hydrolase family 97 catalytic domain-containing protein [Candidatus Cryptobacteroides sp.]
MKYRLILLAALLCVIRTGAAERIFSVASPDGQLEIRVSVSDSITYRVLSASETVISDSGISMTLSDGTVWGRGCRLRKAVRSRVDRTIAADVYKKSEVRDNCNVLVLDFRTYSVEFRAYDSGAAYRFVSATRGPLEILSEKAEFNLGADRPLWVAYSYTKGDIVEQMVNNFENTYCCPSVAEFDPERIAFLPLMADAAGGRKVCITESDLLDYPGMFITKGDSRDALKGVFAAVPKDVHIGGKRGHHELVDSREDYIASYAEGYGVRFPWRIAAVSRNDAEMLDNDLVYCLASAPSGDFSWVRPGKVAWEWWNAWNLKGVDFETGVNDDTYRYYIDFASRNGIEYVILDEGWSVPGQRDLMQVVPEIHLKELVDYASQRNVGIILWAGYTSFSRDVEGICRHYSEMGIKGFKVDFMERDDQKMVRFQSSTAETAAKYGLILDYHGTFKPAGLNRTWPNVVNFEGVFGLEMLKSRDNVDMVTYDVTMPFIRMVAGPLDYTQGAMRNASRKNWRAVYSEPMSQGTRCRQLAEYVIFESPLNMLCDTPSAYMAEKECAQFISSVPTVWDCTAAIDGKVGEYAAVARRKGDEWYVGALTGWDGRDLTLDLSFIPEGDYRMEVFRDGVNASKAASDYAREVVPLPKDRRVTVRMASGGGWAARIYPSKDGGDYPLWLDTASIYHIYPSSFQDSDGDGYGDLEGIRSRLDYIRETGFNTIWISPLFRSAFEDGGYDITDFYSIDPRFGTNSDLVGLVREAHSKGIRVCLDLVAGHTSDKHPWFISSANDGPDSHYADYYIWTDGKENEPPKPDRGGWVDNGYPRDGYYLMNYYDVQPALNYGYLNPDPSHSWEQAYDAPGPTAVREELKRIIAFWFDKGVDGFRCDLAWSLVKGDDVEFNGVRRLWNEIFSWQRERYPDRIFLSEWSSPVESVSCGFDIDIIRHNGCGKTMYRDLVHNTHRNPDADGNYRPKDCWFDRSGKGRFDTFAVPFAQMYEVTKGHGFPCMPTSSHDTWRMNRNQRSDSRELKTMMTFFLTMPWVPIVYYGEEIGMRSQDGAPQVEGSRDRSAQRTPMQWSSGPNAGFSDCAPEKLYLPLDPSPERPCVASQKEDPSSLYNWTKGLLELRKNIPALGNTGDWRMLTDPEKPYPVIYERSSCGERYAVVLNPREEAAEAVIELDGVPEVIYGDPSAVSVVSCGERSTVRVSGVSSAICRIRK